MLDSIRHLSEIAKDSYYNILNVLIIKTKKEDLMKFIVNLFRYI